jgi:hypothetical protein
VRRLSADIQENIMKHVSMMALSLCMALAIPAQAMNHMQPRDQMQAQDSDTVYGYELMTPQERSEYQTRMRSMKTDQEREAFRLEHHKRMQERARAQGKTLPDSPPADRGPGMGPGGGMGPSGGGTGPGY